jgi:hypothetical protein
MISAIKLLILDLLDLLVARVLRHIVELKNIWRRKLSAIHIMEFRLISGQSVYYFISCCSLNILSKVLFYLI